MKVVSRVAIPRKKLNIKVYVYLSIQTLHWSEVVWLKKSEMQLETLDGKRQRKKKNLTLSTYLAIKLKETMCSGLYHIKICVIIVKYSKRHPKRVCPQPYKGRGLLRLAQAKDFWSTGFKAL